MHFVFYLTHLKIFLNSIYTSNGTFIDLHSLEREVRRYLTKDNVVIRSIEQGKMEPIFI